jgi:hypothetical protein
MTNVDKEEMYSYDPCYLLPLIYHDIDRCIISKYTFDAKNYVEKINQVTLEDIEEAFKHLSSVRKVTFAFGGDIDE